PNPISELFSSTYLNKCDSPLEEIQSSASKKKMYLPFASSIPIFLGFAGLPLFSFNSINFIKLYSKAYSFIISTELSVEASSTNNTSKSISYSVNYTIECKRLFKYLFLLNTGIIIVNNFMPHLNYFINII